MRRFASSNLDYPPNDLPPPPQSEAAAAGVGATLRGELLALGVYPASADDLAAKLERAAVPLEHLRAVIGHWSGQPGAWGLGALVGRLRAELVGRIEPAEGWPPPTEGHRHAAAIEARGKREGEQERAEDLRRRRLAADRAQVARLEAEHGPSLDALPAETREWLAQQAGLLASDFTRQLFQRTWGTPGSTVRLRLLEQLAAIEA